MTPPRRGVISQDATLHSRVADAFAAVPGVKEVTYINHPLGADFAWRSQFLVEGATHNIDSNPKKTGHDAQFAMVSYVGPHFSSTISIPIVEGRGFTERDTESSTPVAVVNQTLVRKFFQCCFYNAPGRSNLARPG